MKVTRHILLVVLAGWIALAQAAKVEEKSPAVLMREAIYQEESEGNLDKAIELYSQILEQAAEVERLAARATYQLGLCYLKKGDEAKAAQYFRKAGWDYPQQTSIAQKAQKQLQNITSVDEIIAHSYVIHYKTINTSEDGLKVFNQKHPKGVKTHHANRYMENGQQISSICTNTQEEMEKIVEMLNQHPQLELVKVISPHKQNGSQIILKDSFEEGDETPTEWGKGATVDGVSYIWDQKHGSDGTSSLCLKKDVEKYFPIAQWTRKIEYTGNAKELTVSAQVRAKKAYKATIDALFLDDKGEWIKHEWVSYIGAKETGDKPANHNWKEYSGSVEIPDNTKTIVIGLQMYGPGIVWFDELEVSYASSNINPQALVEDFFKHNFRDVTSRKTLEWGEPTIDENGNISIRYKYEATIWDKDKVINNQVFTFDKNGKFVSVKDIDPSIKQLIHELHNPEAPRFVALNKLINRGEPAVEPLLNEMQRSNNWQVPKALGAIADKRAVGPLIEKWQTSSFSPMKEVIAEALEIITKQQYGQDLKAWQKWWREVGSFYTPQATISGFMQAALQFDVEKAKSYVGTGQP